MNNDILIDQARQLYAMLLVKQYMLPKESKLEIERFNNLVMFAYRRYVRRLNRCVVCYQHRAYDCNREPGKDHTSCNNRRRA